MDAEQVWMQLDLRAQTVCDLLEFALETGKTEEEDLSGEEEETDIGDERLGKMMEAIENGEEVDFDELEEEFGVEMDMDDESQVESDESDDGGDDVIGVEDDIVHLRESDQEHSDSETRDTLSHDIKASALTKRKNGANHGLDDGFFDLDIFNAEMEQAEAKSSSRGRLGEDSDASEDDNMSVDLFAPLEKAEEEIEDAAGESP
jgi:U3 small nucleolar RNA-associated protein MPP10